ncbi:MAG TPA: hypothetical protein VI461_08325 [Chitinophagaceae bacterium]|nr:hypothetical protein [Chitinophagaceae bacterium]
MTTEILREKTGRYLCGQSVPAEKKQIQNWLSCTGDKTNVSEEERKIVEEEIVTQVKAYVVSSLFQPKEENWWKKITASF